MRYKGLDLNLLVVLSVLIEEKNVSAAARRLNISQPGLSACLRRLRDYFDDELLQPNGGIMLPTPLALQMEPHLKTILLNTDDFLLESKVFDPRTSERRFVIAASDYVVSVYLAPLIAEFVELSPRAKIEIVPTSDRSLESLRQGQLDLIIAPRISTLTNLPCQLLLRENFVVAGCASNPIFEQPLTREIFFSAKHVVVRIGHSNPTSIALEKLEELHQKLNEVIQVSSFLAAPQIIIGTQLLTTMHESLAKKMSDMLPIRYVPLPFDIDPMQQFMWYNPMRQNDPSLKWLLGILTERMESVNAMLL